MNQKRIVTRSVSLAFLLGLAYVAGRAGATGIPANQPMTYSGTLTSASGAPLTGTKNIQVVLWDQQSLGASQCASVAADVALDSTGSFHVALPDDCTAKVHAKPDIWAEVVVDKAPLPRTKLGAVPFAVEADTASNAAGPLDTRLQALGTGSVPPGAIMAFDLDACPSGWSAVDSVGGRTIVGVNPSGGNGLSARARGVAFGEETHSMATAELAAHSHSGTTSVGNAMAYRIVYTVLGASTANNHATGWQGGASYTDYNNDQYPVSAHTHNFSTDSVGQGQAFNIAQPSIAFLYCKKN